MATHCLTLPSGFSMGLDPCLPLYAYETKTFLAYLVAVVFLYPRSINDWWWCLMLQSLLIGSQ